MAWFILGMFLTLVTLALLYWLRIKMIRLTWYEWGLGVIGMAIILFAAQNTIGSFMELESKAGLMFLFFPGLIGLVILALAVRLAWQRRRVASARDQNSY